LGRADTREEAAEVIRSLVSAIELVPDGAELAIVLRGDLAAMLSVAADKAKPGAPSREAGLVQGSLVAGTGFEPVTFRL
jgi:site-specific DNA recombinase